MTINPSILARSKLDIDRLRISIPNSPIRHISYKQERDLQYTLSLLYYPGTYIHKYLIECFTEFI